MKTWTIGYSGAVPEKKGWGVIVPTQGTAGFNGKKESES